MKISFFKADYVITLCGDARDKCPALPPSIKSLHWDLEDPARATGTEEEVLNKFREIRDIIKENSKKFDRRHKKALALITSAFKL